MIVYKVCSRNMSFCAPVALEYARGKTTFPRTDDGPLAAFRTLPEAINFAKEALQKSIHRYNCNIWKAASLPWIDPKTTRTTMMKIDGIALWQYGANHIPDRYLDGLYSKTEFTLPEGTVLCRAVRLLKKV